MRSETQNHVDAIRKSLKLLAQRMDWETAPHRLEEFDALIEAPDLWNDPAKAQKLMRERQALLDAVSTYRMIDSGVNDNVELIELGEAEGDAEIIAEAEAALRDLVETARAKELEALLDGEWPDALQGWRRTLLEPRLSGLLPSGPDSAASV